MRILQEGQQIRDTYEVERLLGEGAFAEVYRVKHRFLGRQAMKVFKTPGMTLDEIKNMLGEAELLSKIGHPNIVRVFDANLFEFEANNYGYFTMEYVPGGSLEEYWCSFNDQPMPVTTVINLILQICEGLSVAHGSDPPIVHRDIKPQNILVGYDTDCIRVRVSDFGLAKQVNPLSLLASARGTLVFKPPEVFVDCKRDSCAGDIWALGCVLYLLLTDEFPFPSLGDTGSIHWVDFQRAITPPSKINYQVDDYLEGVINKCLELDPARRYPNAMELRKDLSNWQPNIKSDPKATPGLKEQAAETQNEKDEIEDRAQRLCLEALTLANQSLRLSRAAALMEQAFQISPSLRDKYGYLVRLWRKGVSG